MIKRINERIWFDSPGPGGSPVVGGGIILALLWLSCLVTPGCEIRPIDPETGKVIIEDLEEGFNVAQYVEEIWEGRLMAAVEGNAVELAELLETFDVDPEAAELFGHQEGSRPYSYLVRGTARVQEVDTTSRTGLMKVGSPEIDETFEIFLQIGPVIQGTALRDAIPFIQFDQFTNQIQYANVSRELHRRLIETELSDINHSSLTGKVIQFTGAFAHTSDRIVITPLKIDEVDE